MYRLLSVFLVISIVGLGSGYHGHNHGHHGHHGWHGCGRNQVESTEDNNNYTVVLQKFIDAEKSLEKFCTNVSKVNPLITYGMEGYTLKYPLPAGEVNVDATITNKILKTSVTMKDNVQNSEAFTDLRVLPDILNYDQAGWWILNGKLIIQIPYRVPLMTEFEDVCNTVNNNVINVPVTQVPKFKYRILE